MILRLFPDLKLRKQEARAFRPKEDLFLQPGITFEALIVSRNDTLIVGQLTFDSFDLFSEIFIHSRPSARNVDNEVDTDD